MSRLRPFASLWPWLVVAVLSLGLAAAAWFLGPKLTLAGQPVLQDPALRLFVTLVILLLGVIAALALLLRRPAPASAVAEAPSSDEYGRQSQVLDRAMQRLMLMLRQMRGGGWRDRSYAYALPWYLVAGPAGAGKTSLIQASGLRFGGADRRGSVVAAGPAYTLSLSDRAVFVDSAGALGSQLDRRIWRHFLGLLKRVRRQQPANGVILTLSLPEFRAAAHGQAVAMGGDIRQQLAEMVAHLGVRLPVYVVFTKLDELPGFRSFFSGAAAFPRDGVLGFTLPLLDGSRDGADPDEVAGLVSRGLDELIHWHTPRTLERVNAEAEATARFDAFMFLPEFAALKTKLTDFAAEVFRPSQFEEPLLLRGVYFTSARPDAGRLALTRSPLEPGAPAEVPMPEPGMFIRDLLEKVILPEAGLAGLNAKERRAALATRTGLLGAAAVVALAMVAWWAVSFLGNAHLIDTVRAQAVQARSQLALAADTGGRANQPVDLPVTLAAMKSLQALPTGWDAQSGSVPLDEQGGLSQHDRLARAAYGEYVRALRQVLLPRLVQMIEAQIRASLRDPNELYGALMVYVMLGGEHAIEDDVVAGWLDQLCGQLYPAANGRICPDLDSQTRNLLKVGFDPVALNQPLLAQARTALNALSPALRGMALLKAAGDMTALPPWQLASVTGPLDSYAMVRRSGQPLAETIPGLYTRPGFPAVLTKIGHVAKRVIREDWVRYPKADRSRAPILIETLRREMVDLYVAEYVARWEGLLNDIDIAPFSTFPSEFGVLQTLSGPPSPYAAFLQAVAQNTALTGPQAASAAQTPGGVKQEVSPLTDETAAPARAVTGQFAVLHRFVAGSPSALDGLMTQINQLRSMIGPVASSGGAVPALATEMTAAPGFAQTLNQLQLSVMSAPPPVSDSVLTVVRRTSAIANTSVRSDLNAAWKAQVLPFCQSAIANRYPFAGSATDVAVADFTRMFAPGGLLDQFFARQLKPFVDTSTSPWKLLANAGARPDVTPQALRLFEQASRIRSVFFPGGATAPLVAFAVTPVDLDPGAMRVTLDVDGQSLTYQYGPQQSVPMQWPGTTPGVRVGFGANDPGEPSFVTVGGPWALFRFLGSRSLRRTGSNSFGFTVRLGARTASFSLQPTTADSPFGLNAMAGFRCLPTLVSGSSSS
ncbi:type VI secretion system membrane subunit TssM [Methylobacterium oryzihabitans]|uniref:Type VI secretion system membrane subunit TssM n=1 Tax=Methylobacterium oryzihabitans TaxID=2499852 RepID=A0A437P3X3_9HYPH|nr:type VI secretion system membrane subunit TssM [Methylobacterium oryzihabitans]RVU16926.1 type VI secretion system membrane subunit TssM [Methylobacterium oryzihabitans]